MARIFSKKIKKGMRKIRGREVAMIFQEPDELSEPHV